CRASANRTGNRATSSWAPWIVPYRGRTIRPSWPRAFRAFGKLPATSPRPPTLARGYASAAAKRIFIGISEWTDGRYLNLRLARLSSRLPPGRGDPFGHGRAFAKGFSLEVHAEGSDDHSARSHRLRASQPSTVGPRQWSLAATGEVARRCDGRWQFTSSLASSYSQCE